MTNISVQGGSTSFQQPLPGRVVTLNQGVESKQAPITIFLGLEVVANPTTQTSSAQIPSRGVVIQGAFVPLELPEDISIGERVDVKQTKVAGQARFEFVASVDTRSEVEPGSTDSLKTLLQALKINDESIKVLRQLLGSANSNSLSGANRQLALADTLAKLLVASGVPQSGAPSQSSKIKEAIINPVNQQLLKVLSQALKNRDGIEGSETDSLFLEKVRQFISELKALGVSSGGDLKLEAFKKQLASTFPDLEPDLKILLQKLELLTDTQDSPTAKIVAELKKLIASQLELFPLFEARMKALLVDAFSSEGALPGLFKLLQNLSEQDQGSDAILQPFVKKLLKDIEHVVQKQAGPIELRQVLKEGLQALYKDFNLASFDENQVTLTTHPSQANRHIKGTLRLIESQLTTLITSSDLEKELESLSKNAIKQTPHLEGLRASLKDLIEKDAALIPEPLRLEVAQKLAELDVILRNDKPSVEVVRRLLQGLREVIVIEAGKENQLPVREQALAQINSAITLVLEELESAVDIGAPRQTSSLSQAHKLKELLKSITLDFPVSKSALNDDLLSETYRVVGQLEQLTEHEVVSPQIKQQLQGLLARYQQLIEKMTMPAERESGLHFIERETLTQVSAMISSQETLQRFAPFVKAMGEPVFMLFPLLFGNILSQAQVTYRSGESITEDGDDCHAAPGSEVFHRLQISVPLPKLGQVAIDLAYRKGELLLNILVQSKMAREVIEKHLYKLRKIFSVLGYYKNQIEVANKDLYVTEQLSLINNSDESTLTHILKYQAQG